MADNEMLRLILDEIKGLEKRFDGLEQDFAKLALVQVRMEQDITSIKKDITVVKKDVASINKEVREMSYVVTDNYKRLEATTDMAHAHERKLEGIKDVLNVAV